MLGNTGLEISEIGLGCEGFVGKDEHETEELLNLAQKKGINYLDLYSLIRISEIESERC